MARRSTMKSWRTMRGWMVRFCIAATGVIAWSLPAMPQAPPPTTPAQSPPTTPKNSNSNRLPKTSRAAAIRLVQDVTSPVRKREDAIRKKLAKRTSVDLQGETLGGVIKKLAKLGDFKVIFDPEAIAAGDITLDAALAGEKLERTSIRRIIEFILSNHADVELALRLQNGVLNIVTEEKADTLQSIRIFSIAGIVKPKVPAVEPDPELQQTPTEEFIQELNQGFNQFNAVTPETALVVAIKRTTSAIWEEDDPQLGGTINEVGNYLVVRQTQEVLEQVEGLLRGLEIAGRDELKSSSFQVRHPLYDHTADADARLALGETISVDYKDATLAAVLEDLRKKTGLPLFADPDGVASNDIARDEIINLNLKSCTLRSALNLILEQHTDVELSFHVNEGIATVMPKEKVDSIHHATIYDIRDFLKADIDVDTLITVIKDQSTGIWEEEDPDLGGAIADLDTVGALVIRQTQPIHTEIAGLFATLRSRLQKAGPQATVKRKPKKPAPTDDSFATEFYPFVFKERATAMQASLKKFIAPKTWDAKDSEVAIAIVEGTLIIRQTVKVHREIQEFLRKLDKAERLNTESPGDFGSGLGGVPDGFGF